MQRRSRNVIISARDHIVLRCRREADVELLFTYLFCGIFKKVDTYLKKEEKLMITQEKIDRINHLAHKKKTIGLTEEELAEQKILYKDYIAAFRDNLKAQLDMIEIAEEVAEEENLCEREEKACDRNDYKAR